MKPLSGGGAVKLHVLWPVNQVVSCGRRVRAGRPAELELRGLGRVLRAHGPSACVVVSCVLCASIDLELCPISAPAIEAAERATLDRLLAAAPPRRAA